MAENSKQVSKETKKEEYIRFRDMPTDDIKKLPGVPVKLEYQKTKFGDRIKMTVEFDPQFEKESNSPKIIDKRKYQTIILDRKDFDLNENVHLTKLPIRYLERHDVDGNVKYRRFEVMFSRDAVVSDFFDKVDEKLIDKLNLKFPYQEDKDSSEEFTLAQSEIDYVHFE